MKYQDKALITSWLLATAIIGTALFSTPNMLAIAQGKAPESFLTTLAIYLFSSLICGWPWFALLDYEKNIKIISSSRKIAFSLISLLITGYFFSQIASAPSEGVGLNIIACVLTVWLSYPLTKIF